ncbi:cystatin-B-like [Neolamprologus brichardi]|uniref:Cystatin-B n=1 Tax=Neolamprologus brichardi TaxID=32507 RepID=A0A3Q4IE82_NEOBR|nr:cystatin-B-like [Neolamprologus brichardi]
MADVICGGWSETKTADEQIQKICDNVKNQVEKETHENYVEFHAVEYRSQVVAGANYLIKVHVGGTSYLHLMVWQRLPCDGGQDALTGVQQHHHKDDPLVPF